MARKLRWTDVHDIAIELEESHPDVDNVNLRFTDLHRWVMELPDFEDDPNRSNEKILKRSRPPGSRSATSRLRCPRGTGSTPQFSRK